MSPFGQKKEEKEREKEQKVEEHRRTLQGEFERLDALPLKALAAEVMTKGFGPGSPGADDDAISSGQANADAGPTAEQISFEFVPARGFTFPLPTPGDFKLRDRIAKLVSEGLQELEHASLVRFQMHTAMGHLDWTATRRGRVALQRGEVQNILEATRM